MKLVSNAEAEQWLLQHGHSVARRMEPPPDQNVREIRIGIPRVATEVLSMAYALLTVGLVDDDEVNFRGSLVWLRQWEIWSESIDRIGHILLQGLYMQSGDDTHFETRPGFVFAADEFAKSHAALAVAMLFQWDAIVFPVHPDFHAHISHDGYMDVEPATSVAREALLQRFGRQCL
jgi:hypothetical protein